MLTHFQRMQTDPPAGVSASPVADNVMQWYVLSHAWERSIEVMLEGQVLIRGQERGHHRTRGHPIRRRHLQTRHAVRGAISK